MKMKDISFSMRVWILLKIFGLLGILNVFRANGNHIQPLTNFVLSSESKFSSSSSWRITVPSTVIGGLLQNPSVYGPANQIFFDSNLDKIKPANFSKTSHWFYKTEFHHEGRPSDHVIAHFKGINYRGNLWVNDHLVVSQSQFVGTFREFQFDITPYISITEKNTLVVQIYRPQDFPFPPGNNSTDLSISFIDWNPPPVDGSMGIFRPVELIYTSGVLLSSPMVSSQIATDYSSAQLDVLVQVDNVLFSKNLGILQISLDLPSHVKLETSVTLEAQDSQQVWFRAKDYPQLNIKNPQLWWPWQMGNQTMYNLLITFTPNSSPSQKTDLKSRFGIRQTTSTLTSKGYRLYSVNHKPILVRGGGFAPDMFLREFDEKVARTHFAYVRNMGFNAIRLEGKMETEMFFSLADEYGILMMPGWACCDAWQHWFAWQKTQYEIAEESLRTQVRRYRIHPSVLVFLYSSDQMPPNDVESLYLNVFKDEAWPNPVLASASDLTSNITGPTGVKMSGPYSWVPPIYWSEGAAEQKLGGAFGFLTEGGPGEAPLTFESFSWTVSEKYFWPINEMWDFHCGNPEGLFYNLRFFVPPVNARYGISSSAEEFLQKSQVAEYEAMRAMFEAYSRNKYTSTGLIQWMLNNAWPEMIWHTYDYYFNQGGSYFGSKKACELLHIQYEYYDRSVWIVNSAYEDKQNFFATAQLFNIYGENVFEKSQRISSVTSDGVLRLFTLPDFGSVANLTEAFFVRLMLYQGSSSLAPIANKNVYWLSKTADVLEWGQSNFYRTPCSQYANLTGLAALPEAKVSFKADTVHRTDGQTEVSVVLTNEGSSIAFFVRLRLVDQTGKDILPIFWNDNYVTLIPGETETLRATFQSSVERDTPKVIVESYNNIV